MLRIIEPFLWTADDSTFSFLFFLQVALVVAVMVILPLIIVLLYPLITDNHHSSFFFYTRSCSSSRCTCASYDRRRNGATRRVALVIKANGWQTLFTCFAVSFFRSASFKEDEGTWKGTEDGKVVNNQPQRVMDPAMANGIVPAAGYIAK